MLHLLSKNTNEQKCFQNRPNCVEMKQDVGNDKPGVYLSPLSLLFKGNRNNPISSYPVIENSPVFS